MLGLKFNKKCALVFSSLFGITGCASMFGDNTRQVRVDSHPQGANIYIDEKYAGTTPAVITLSRYIYGGQQLVLKKQNYRDQTAMVTADFQLVSLWNILNFPIGTIVDWSTGNILKIDSNSLNISVDLLPVSAQKQRDIEDQSKPK